MTVYDATGKTVSKSTIIDGLWIEPRERFSESGRIKYKFPQIPKRSYCGEIPVKERRSCSTWDVGEIFGVSLE